MVGVIIDAFYDPKEQALLSLSGRPCKSIAVEKRVQKTQFPVDLKTAIFSKFPYFIFIWLSPKLIWFNFCRLFERKVEQMVRAATDKVPD